LHAILFLADVGTAVAI